MTSQPDRVEISPEAKAASKSEFGPMTIREAIESNSTALNIVNELARVLTEIKHKVGPRNSTDVAYLVRAAIGNLTTVNEVVQGLAGRQPVKLPEHFVMSPRVFPEDKNPPWVKTQPPSLSACKKIMEACEPLLDESMRDAETPLVRTRPDGGESVTEDDANGFTGWDMARTFLYVATILVIAVAVGWAWAHRWTGV